MEPRVAWTKGFVPQGPQDRSECFRRPYGPSSPLKYGRSSPRKYGWSSPQEYRWSSPLKDGPSSPLKYGWSYEIEKHKDDKAFLLAHPEAVKELRVSIPGKTIWEMIFAGETIISTEDARPESASLTL